MLVKLKIPGVRSLSPTRSKLNRKHKKGGLWPPFLCCCLQCPPVNDACALSTRASPRTAAAVPHRQGFPCAVHRFFVSPAGFHCRCH